MLHLLQTIGLLATLGIILPIAIHLWNKKEGKTLRIGSVKLLVEAARQQARSLRLKDLLLLLLRCTIIIFLALLLAKPVWQKQLFTKEKKGWIVLEKSDKVYKHYNGLIDSLLRAGFEAHHFIEGFPIIKPDDTAQAVQLSDTVGYWPLLKALNEQVPDDLPVYLFTGNRLSNFTGSRPGVRMKLNWLTFASSDTATGNILDSRLTVDDSIETTVANSTAAYTTYEIRKQKAPAIISDDFMFSTTDTSILRIGILRDPSGNDAHYLQAAFTAIQQFGQYRMQLTTSADPGSFTGHYDWIFWLSEQEIPVTLKAENIFRYEKGRENVASTWMESPGNNEQISMSKVITTDTVFPGQAIWISGYGEPVLTCEKSKKNIYHFYSRFDPAWTGLVWSESFPKLLFDIMLKKKIRSQKDNRSIDTQQMQPATTGTETESIKPAFIGTIDLSKWVWVAAFLLFATERVIVLKTKKQTDA